MQVHWQMQHHAGADRSGTAATAVGEYAVDAVPKIQTYYYYYHRHRHRHRYPLIQ